jgi:hypothetical protein
MKLKFLVIVIFISNYILACKCENLDLTSSFNSADFVFSGTIYDVLKSPSGFRTVDNYLSKVKIEKIYKSNNYDGFYKSNATIFASKIRSCDIIFDKKGQYLIFAYYEPDTGFIYSERCLFTKEMKLVTNEDLKLLAKLNENYLEELETENAKPIGANNIELIIDDFSNQPNRKIRKLENENELLKTNNKVYRIGIIIICIILLLVTAILVIFKRRNIKLD